MILVCGIPSEPPVQAAIDAARRGGLDCAVFDQRQAAAYEIVLDVDRGAVSGALVLADEAVELGEIEGVYARLVESDCLPFAGRGANLDEERAHSRVLHAALDEWLEAAPCRVANRSSAMASNVSKPFQAGLIRRAGFETPPTLVTNLPEQAQAFARANGQVVFKSVSSVRSIVQRLDADRASRLGRLRRLPTQFQRLVEGLNVRVHVVGSRVFATEIESDVVDYRYAGRDGSEAAMRAVALSPEMEARCRRLSASLQLPFCGIDLLRRPDGSYVCLEVNPSPAYTYYEEATGQPIAEALVGYLAGRS